MKVLMVADICWGDGGFGCFLIGLIWGFIGSLWAGGSLGVVSCCVGGDGVGAGAGVDLVVVVAVVLVCSSFSFCFCCFSFLSIDLVLIVVVVVVLVGVLVLLFVVTLLLLLAVVVVLPVVFAFLFVVFCVEDAGDFLLVVVLCFFVDIKLNKYIKYIYIIYNILHIYKLPSIHYMFRCLPYNTHPSHSFYLHSKNNQQPTLHLQNAPSPMLYLYLSTYSPFHYTPLSSPN